ncbi:MAG: DUF222 domain-containing protein [Actinomycetota bacterium]
MSVSLLTDQPPTIAAAVALTEAVDVGTPLLGCVDDVAEAVDAVELVRRLSAVASVDVMQSIDDSRIFLDQGHASAQVMFAHLAGISGSEAWRLDRIRRMVHGRAEGIAEAWRGGGLGLEQAVTLAKVYANPRVRDRFLDDQCWFLARATKDSFVRFQKRIGRWLDLHDEDGPTPAPDPSHERRDVTLAQDYFSKAWNGRMSLGSAAGSRFNEVLTAYTDAEALLDWEAARAEHGDAATRDDLPRSAAQRRADALCQMAEDAAANANASVRVKRVHNLVWQGETAEELVRRWFGGEQNTLDIDEYGVADLNGHIVHAPSAIADLVTGSFRRVVQNAAGVAVDISKEQRLFTGLARLGIELQTDECYWPGCHKPTTGCQIDHLRPAACGGRSEQRNGGPACPRHNLRKEAGYTVTRGVDGTITIITPAGDTVR